jgi:hypothetical protein
MMLRIISALLVLNVVCAWGESPWLPGAGKAAVTMTYVEESFSSYWTKSAQVFFPQPPSPAKVFGQSTGYGLLEYGLSDKLSLDVLMGYTATTYGTQGVQGMSDSLIGMRYQVYSDERSAITLRGAANIAGTYPLVTTSRFNAGDKVSGGQGSVLAGTTFSHGIYLYGEAGWRYRDKPVPNVFFGTAGVGDRIGRFSYGLAYQHNQALSGIDIGTPQFHGFPYLRQTMQIQQILDANVGYTTPHGLYFGFDFAHLLAGRDAGDKQIFAFTFGFTIPGRGPYIH